MTIQEATKLLELPDHATPKQVDARFLELRTKLEERIALALTPGLKAKYQEGLASISEARRVLLAGETSGPVDTGQAAQLLGVSADDTVDEIVARAAEMTAQLEERLLKAPTPGLESRYREALVEIEQARDVLLGTSAVRPTTPASQVPPSIEAASIVRPSRRRPLVWAGTVAVLVLAGVFAVLHFRNQEAGRQQAAAEAATAAQAEIARQAAEVAETTRLAEQERAAARERERERKIEAEAAAEQKRLAARVEELRGRLAAALVGWERAERSLRETEQELADLRSEPSPVHPARQAEFTARHAALEDMGQWLRGYLAEHPARKHRRRAEEALTDGRLKEAATATEALAGELDNLEETIQSESERRLSITGSAEITSEPVGLDWELTDGAGKTWRGQTPTVLGEITPGPARVIFSRPSWPEVRRNVEIHRHQQAAASAVFSPGAVNLMSRPAGATVRREGTVLGTTPLKLEGLPPASQTYDLELAGYLPATVSGQIRENQTLELSATLKRRITEADYPVVYFYRPGAFSGMAVGVRVFLSGQLAGELGNRSHVAVRLKPGRHRFALEWWGGRTSDFAAEFAPNQTYYFLTALDDATKVKLTTEKGIGYAVRSEAEGLADIAKSRGEATPRLLPVEPEVPYLQ